MGKSRAEFRAELQRLLAERRHLLRRLVRDGELAVGTVSTVSLKCGKPNCRCAEGPAHSSMVLSWSEGGRTRLLSVPEKRLDELRRQTEQYQRFRRARARLVKIHKSMLDVVNRIEEARRREP